MKFRNGIGSLICWLLFCGLITLTLSACPKKQTVKKTEVEETEEEEEDIESSELDIHGKDFVESKNLGMVHFAYDSSSLTAEAREILASNADYLKKNPDLEVLSEGHCDQRGTVGYNLALGQRRAQAVRKYYISLGMNPEIIGSLSYGKESPLCMEDTEECWTTNRRVSTKIRALTAAQKEEDPEMTQEDSTE